MGFLFHLLVEVLSAIINGCLILNIMIMIKQHFVDFNSNLQTKTRDFCLVYFLFVAIHSFSFCSNIGIILYNGVYNENLHVVNEICSLSKNNYNCSNKFTRFLRKNSCHKTYMALLCTLITIKRNENVEVRVNY